MLPSSLRSIFHTNMELSYTRQSNDFCDMATPRIPIAILLSHLQALSNVIILTFVIAISSFSGGVCTQYTDIWRGTKWTSQLLYGHEQRLVNLTCMRPKVFRLHYYTKVGSRDRGLVAERGSLELLTDINHGLCEAKSGASYGGLPNDRLIYRFTWGSAVAATNYKMGDTKRRTDWTNMIWSRFATECTLNKRVRAY